MSETTIKVQSVSKFFKINHEQHDKFRDLFMNLFKEKKPASVFTALDTISFEVQKGDFFGIIGRNGSGKSTLLKIIAGIYAPNEGGVEVNGKLIPFLELGVGFNPQLSARENIYLNGIILGMTKREVEEKYDEILDFAEVREFEDMPLKTFSSGMSVRLAFAIAIQAKGDIYLLDEVFAVGDIGFQQKSLAVIKSLIEQGKTIIFVSHDLESIKTFCNRCVVIDKSKLLYDGDAQTAVEIFRERLGQ